ncbi:asparagine synthase (glutamine-hydrolyzing) [Geobacter pelophilus]|uniref:asparagine synthase (glutamine-hydrolyzing) n=1 Tax=Geoanaerobacter pelophilus TaxID=60036 RepID=A0AAW4KVZ3_9BACT|nr:asparagine synthase (glutamine-hydrolyzing) [Geoanaerobacter pelophilus]MBT0662716.1 asparagine synthase (glutamine-hydrolyzing) [Geoanaerobacter pelophilus]
MCGIAGLIYTDQARFVDPSVIEAMCTAIHHRGPDEWGMWLEGAVGIGMKRLQIIDLAGGHQPMANQDATIHIVFNGEIYNYRELRADLEKRGYRFATNSDTESILHLYEEYGQECVTHLRGMFAFAIWDSKKYRLFMARDRLGKKPLHYLYDREKIVFGSEIKSILRFPSLKPEVNSSSIANYIAYGYSPDPDTLFRGINKLPPGHRLTWESGRISIDSYWDIEYQPDYSLSQQQVFEETERLLEESIKIRLVSDVPLGAFLSGGIDSSLVVALMARNMGAPVKTFSIGFDEKKYNELPYARMVAEQYGTDHHEEIVRPDAEEVIPHLIKMFDEPFADSSAIPTYYVSRLARQHVTVALSGDGGDEMFGGYDRYLDSKLSVFADKMPLPIRKAIMGTSVRYLPESFPGINTLRYLAADLDERYIAKMTKGVSWIHGKLFSPELIAQVGTSDPSGPLRMLLPRVKMHDTVTRRQYLDCKTYLPGDIMTKVDRASMSVSLEARAPMLDHLFVEFAFRVPVQYKVSGRTTKYMLKQLAYKLLPHDIVDRPKMGFAMPVAQWINREWKEMSEDLVIGTRALQRGNFNPGYLKNMVEEHRRGRRDHSYIIWTLMVLEMWYRELIDGKLRND